jgi:hypothetical protein
MTLMNTVKDTYSNYRSFNAELIRLIINMQWSCELEIAKIIKTG